MELQELKNKMLTSEFIMGNKIKIKSVEEIQAIDNQKPDSSKFDFEWYQKYYKVDAPGNEFVSCCADKYGRVLVLYRGHKKDPYNTFTIDLKYIDFTNDVSKPSEEAITLCHEIVKLNKCIFMSTTGEVHGSSEHKLMTAENTYPGLNLDGESVIFFPITGSTLGHLDLVFAKQLLETGTIDKSINTGLSYIPRNLKFYTEKEAEKKSFKY